MQKPYSKKEYMIVTHGSIELLEKHINRALEHGWNILGYPMYADGKWCQAITRTTYSDDEDEFRRIDS